MAYKSVERKGTVMSLIEEGYSELEELGNECQEASDNFPNSNHPKAEAFGEVASTLTGLSMPDTDAIEAADADGEVTYFEQVNRDKRKGPSRAIRAANAAAKLTGAASALRSKIEELNEQELPDQPEAADLAKDAIDEKVSGLETLADELEDHANEAEGVEFPGLYG